jgi:hypothetical protein
MLLKSDLLDVQQNHLKGAEGNYDFLNGKTFGFGHFQKFSRYLMTLSESFCLFSFVRWQQKVEYFVDGWLS